jgi:hypothetical protein
MLNWERPQRGMADVAGLNPFPETICAGYNFKSRWRAMRFRCHQVGDMLRIDRWDS